MTIRPPSVVRGIAVSALGNLGAPLVALISAPILAQSLGVTSRGEVAAATAPLLLAVNALTLGLPEAITYYTASRRNHRRSPIARGSLYLGLLGLLGTAVLLLLVPLLAPPGSPTADAMSLAALAFAPSLLLGGIRAYAAGKARWALISGERFFSSVLRLAIFLALVAQDSLTVFSASITIAGTGFAGMAVYVLLLVKRTEEVDESFRVRNKPRLVSFGLRVWVGALSGILLSRLDQVLMIPLSTSYEIGLYAVAVSISEITLIFNSAVRDVLFSSESTKSNDTRLSKASRVSTLITLLGAAVIGVASIWLLPFLFGQDFQGALVVLWILLLAVVMGNPGSVAGAGLSARGRPGLRSFALLGAFVVNLAFVFLLVPEYGAVGAAWATFAGNLVAGTLCIIFLGKHFDFKIMDFYLVRRKDFVGIVPKGRNLRRKASISN